MLVKSGDWRTAQILYRNATLSPDFSAWPYAQVLERRIVEAEANVAAFNAPPPTGNDASGQGEPPADVAAGDHRLMIDTRFSCMGCHQSLRT